MKETKREKFVRLAEARTNKILDQIRLLSNLANKGNYDFNDEDAKRIFSALEKEIKHAKSAFAGEEINDQRFKLN
jgi:hypothetical protein